MAKNICSVAGCERFAQTRLGWCLMHYRRWKRQGDPEKVVRPLGIPLAERIDHYTVPLAGEDACHAWIGQFGRHMRAMLQNGKQTKVVARLIWEIRRGPIPDKLHVLHRCDHPWCVNDNHFWLGTHAENMADAARKGRLSGRRISKEMRRHNAFLNPCAAAEIRLLHFVGGYTYGELATKFDVSYQTIFNICRRNHWTTPDA